MIRIRTTLGLAALAVALSCAPLLAQGGPDELPAPSADPGGPGPAGPGTAPGPTERGPDAQRRRWDRGPGGERRDHGPGEFSLARLLSDPEIQQKVGVSAEQVAKIRQQESNFRKTEIRQHADVQVQEVDLRDLLAAQSPDRSAIDAKLQQVSSARLALQRWRIDFRLDMKAALTPDQQQKLRAALRERWQARRGPGNGRPAARGQGEPGAGGQGGPGAGAVTPDGPDADSGQ